MKNKKLIDIYVITLFTAAFSAVILRVFALLRDFDPQTMQFGNSVTMTLANLLVILSIVIFAGYILFKKENPNLIAKVDNAASFIPSGIVSTALIFMGVHLIKNMNGHSLQLLRPISIFAAILAFASAASFFLSIFIEGKSNNLKAAFSISVVIFLALYACYLYFNREVHPTNSQSKIIDQMAYLFSAVFFLYESRITIGRAKWRPYVAFGLMASLCCIYSSLPSLILYALDGRLVSDSLIESVLTLTLAIFITSKILQTKGLTPDEECETAKSIAALAEMRQEEIEELRRNIHARANDNMEEKDDHSADVANYTFDIPYVETRSEFSSDDTPLE